MIRAIRNRLTDLLLGALRHNGQRDAILWLSIYCVLRARGRAVDVTGAELQAELGRRYPALAASEQAFIDTVGDLEGLLRVRRSDVASVDAVELRVEPHPDLLPFLSAACERVQLYAQVVLEAKANQAVLEHLPVLRRAVAEAALCFNAGLFFEAHEHLEHHWVGLPPDPTKRFIQGIVQISVGFYHAMRGSYEGAVNQLGKGLEKLAAPSPDTLGVDVPRFRREVIEVRERIIACGRAGMRKAGLDELPRMYLIS